MASAALRADFVTELGRQLLVAGYNVIDVRDQMDRVAKVQGATDPESGVFPTYVTYNEEGSSEFRAHVVAPNALRFDHAMTVHSVATEALAGGDMKELMHRLHNPGLRKRRTRWAQVGYALAAGGFSLILGARFADFVLAVLLGYAVAGLLRVLHGPRQETVAPVIAAFLASVVACALAAIGIFDLAPLPVAMASVVLLIPTGGIVNGAEELAGGEMMSGTSRLVYSLVQLFLLALAIFGGYQLVASGAQVDGAVALGHPAWVGYIGVFMFCIGAAIFTQAPVSIFGWILLVVALSFGSQQFVASELNDPVAAGFAAFVGMMVALTIQRRGIGGGPPALVTFTPAFWVLLPGTFAIGTLIQALSSDLGGQAGMTILFILCAIVVGCICASLMASLIPVRKQRELVS